MLLENIEAPVVSRDATTPSDAPRRRSTDGLTDGLTNSMQNDVDRLIDIAGQLFGAIERQLHSIEHDLDDAPSEPSEASDQWVFKEQLMRTASSLHASLNEIAVHLGGQARGTLSPPDLVE